MHLVILLLCVAILCPSHAARIMNYTVTAVGADMASSFPWAAYDTTVNVSGTVSNASNEDDSHVFDPIGFQMPYFQQENMSWFISSNGFLSPSDAPLCNSFCTVSYTYDSPYQLSASTASDVSGAYPSIQLFSGDLNPTQANSGKIYKRVYAKNIGDGAMVSVAIVSFHHVPRYSVSALSSGDFLTAQAELWPNGTIILRYEATISPLRFLSTIGLAWTARQHVYLTQYATAAAIRLDPVLDACNDYTACSLCVASPGRLCSWCDAMSLCVHRNVVDDYCPMSQRNACNLSDVPANQKYYAMKQTSDSPSNTNDRFMGDVNATIPGSTVYDAPWTNVSNPIVLPFSPIGVFYNPPVWNRSSPFVRTQVTITDVGILSLLGSSQACAVSGYCANGNYQFALLGVAEYNAFVPNQTVVEIGLLPHRSAPLCGADAQINGSCPAALVVRVSNVSYYAFPRLQYSYTMMLDSTGRLAIRYDRASVAGASSAQMPIIGYPVPSFGLIRNGLSDPSGVAVPWGSLTVGTTLVFSPIPTCLDCGIGGSCNTSSFQCVCKPNFKGDACDECQPGHFGTTCASCPDCGVHGVCDDGHSGFGTCSCTVPYSGRYCDVKCDAAPYTCTGCNGKGGYCECGTCVCNTTLGWSGTNCSQWTDPCYALSIYGCPVCTANKALTCSFCSASFVCMADPNQAGVGAAGNFSVCSTSLQTSTSSGCSFARQSAQPTNTAAVIFVLLTFGALGFVACLLFTCICACKKRRMNHMAIHAVTGTPNFKFPRREREIVQMVLVPFQGSSGKPVQGIPLKQIPMKELFLQQQASRKRDQGTRNVRDWETAVCREE
jgi:hypothetical protein